MVAVALFKVKQPLLAADNQECNDRSKKSDYGDNKPPHGFVEEEADTGAQSLALP